jgi:hypothetical protein
MVHLEIKQSANLAELQIKHLGLAHKTIGTEANQPQQLYLPHASWQPP